MIISFDWTAEAVRARRKTVTRRNWTPLYALRFKPGKVVRAFDKDPRWGGGEICLVRVLAYPSWEPLSYMPDSDYEAEGFAFLNENPHLIPKSMPYDVSREGFEAWRQSGGSMWVVRFTYDLLGHGVPRINDYL